MDLYLVFLALGVGGLGVMAMSGFMHHGSGHGAAGHAGHGHVGHGHAGHAGAGHAGAGHAGAGHAGAGHAVGGHASAGHAPPGSAGGARSAAVASVGGRLGLTSTLMTLMSPRTLFSVCLGMGTAGLLLRPFLSGFLLFIVALAAGLVFERILVTPIWNFAFRFESNPAHTLESSTGGDATAVRSFDANGQGLVSIEVDGQIVQLLGTLCQTDREFRARIPAGTKLRVDEVDTARNRCTVSLI